MASQIIRFPAAGCVVEFMQGNRPVQAWVLEEQGGQLRLYTINKREMKLPAARLLPWSGPVYGASSSRSEIQERLELHRSKRDKLAEELSLEELWELAQGEVAQADIVWFAELLWPEPDIDHIAALGQAMLAYKTHFKFSPPFFEIYTAEQVEQRIKKQEHEDMLLELVQAGTDFFRKLYEISRGQYTLAGGDVPVGEIAGGLKKLLMERIADPDVSDQDGLWKMLTKNLSAKNISDDPHLPMILAQSWGIVPEHHNYLMDRMGYEPAEDWHQLHAGSCTDLTQKIGGALNGLPEFGAEKTFVTIDPASTKDWDDAFYLRRSAEGYELSVAVACPAFNWPFGSAMDKAVLRRASSLYLPEGDHFMMPRQLCYGLFSLESGQTRPMLLLDIELDQDGKVQGVTPRFGKGAVSANFSLSESEQAISSGEGPAAPYAEMLQEAYGLARKLREKRIANGAIITERNDLEITLQHGEGGVRVHLKPEEAYECSHLLVGEIMILSNTVLAEWGRDNGVPLLYRTQVANLPKEFAGVWTKPDEINRVLKSMPPARLSVEPRQHAGVGAEAYSSFTAPMRRYLDLVNQAQLLSFLQAGQARLSKEELEGLLPLLNSRLDSVGQVQRFRTRYWKLLYLQQQDQKNKELHYWEAVITDDGALVTVALTLTGLILRAPKKLFGDRVSVGDTVGVRVGKINPLRNEIQIMEVVDY